MTEPRNTRSHISSTPIDDLSEERRNIDLAQKLAKKRLQDGTATSQVIVHYLQLATEEAKLKRKQLELNNDLVVAKTAALNQHAKIQALVEDALRAFRTYAPPRFEEGDLDDGF